MIIRTHRNFDKKYIKLPNKVQEQFKKRRDMFITQPFHPLLNNHSVGHAYPNCRSINITGDYRALFQENDNEVLFVNIGTHSD